MDFYSFAWNTLWILAMLGMSFIFLWGFERWRFGGKTRVEIISSSRIKRIYYVKHDGSDGFIRVANNSFLFAFRREAVLYSVVGLLSHTVPTVVYRSDNSAPLLLDSDTLKASTVTPGELAAAWNERITREFIRASKGFNEEILYLITGGGAIAVGLLLLVVFFLLKQDLVAIQGVLTGLGR